MQSYPIKEREKYEEDLLKNGFEPERLFRFGQKFLKTVEQNNGQFYKLILFYGKWKIPLYVYRTDAPSIYIERPELGSGHYASVYKMNTDERQVACKVIKIPSNINLDIDIILKEIFLLKIASILGTGPQFENIYGYDVIITKNTVEFAMEYCLTNKLLIFE